MKICALCLKASKLRKSHIVPDFIFKRLQGPNKEFHILYTDDRRKQIFNKTFAERLLCPDCELQFAKWEGYASQFFYGGTQLAGEFHENILVLAGVDYTQMKLFLMSLLWRFGVSSNPWFKGLDLGPHEEILRSMLLNSDPGEPAQYGCIITSVMRKRQQIEDLIVPPSPCMVDGHKCQRIVVGGYLYAFFVTSHQILNVLKEGVLQKDGRLFISFCDIMEIEFLNAMAQKIAAKARKADQ